MNDNNTNSIELGTIRGKTLLIVKHGDFESLYLGDYEIDENNIIRDVYFNDDWIIYTWGTAYDRFTESIIVKVDVIEEEQNFPDKLDDPNFQGCDSRFYWCRGWYTPLKYTIDIQNELVTHDNTTLTFEELYAFNNNSKVWNHTKYKVIPEEPY